MKASQRYFPLLLLLHKVSPAKSNVKSVDEILKCDHISGPFQENFPIVMIVSNIYKGLIHTMSNRTSSCLTITSFEMCLVKCFVLFRQIPRFH